MTEKKRILIVEDDHLISTIFKMFLNELGHELLGIFEDAEEALKQCDEQRPEVILMDIHLAGSMDGIQAAEIIKRNFDIPVIYISSDTNENTIKRAIYTNAYGYLVKPINKKELGISINLAYHKHKLDTEQRKQESNLRSFISEAPDPIIILNSGNIQYLNNAALNLLKTHYLEDIISLPFENFVPEGEKEKIKSLLKSINKDNKTFKNVSSAIINHHGKVENVSISGVMVTFNNTESIQLNLRSISEEIRNNKLLSAHSELLDMIERPLLVTDIDGKIILQNASFSEFTEGDNSKENIKELVQSNELPSFYSSEDNSSSSVVELDFESAKHKATLIRKNHLFYFIFNE